MIGSFLCPSGARAGAAPEPARWSASRERPPAIEVVAPASAPMQFAASELARYLGRILDAPVAVGAPAAGNQPRIVIEKVADPAPLGDERYTILAEGATLHIRGGGDLGVVFGVYEFLRRYGGCRFSGLGPDGELVPRTERVTATGLPLSRKPLLWPERRLGRARVRGGLRAALRAAH